MSLISREAAIEAVKIPDDGCSNPSERHGIIFARVEARRAIQSIPSVNAMPLDKFYELCEETKARVPCAICEKVMPEWCRQHNKPTLTGRDWWDCPAWKQILTKWMEEQDAAD